MISAGRSQGSDAKAVAPGYHTHYLKKSSSFKLEQNRFSTEYLSLSRALAGSTVSE